MKKIIAVLALACAAMPLSAKRSTFNINNHEFSGVNGLKYALQKPLGNDTFPELPKSRIYIGAGAGGSLIGNTMSQLARPGLHGSAEIGGWFSPSHGLRVVGDGGRISVHAGAPRHWFGDVHVDYLLNISNLLRGYSPDRRFELLGTVGPEYQKIRVKGKLRDELGIGMSFQMRVNFAPTLFFFVEPRLALMSGVRYDNPANDIYRMRAQASLSVGLGYRLLRWKYRMQGADDFIQCGDDNLYFGTGFGPWCSPRVFRRRGIYGQAYIGKQLSASSALQLTAAAGTRGGDLKTPMRQYFGIGTLDYVLNLNGAIAGYRPRHVFNLLMNVGVGAGASQTAGQRHVSPAFGAGLTALFKLTHNWALTIHPQVYFLDNEFFWNIGMRRPVLACGDIGLRYTIGDFSQRFSSSYDDYDESKKWFISAGGGYARRFRRSYGHGADVSIGFGRHMTPASSWRAQINGSVFPRFPRAFDMTVHLDYLTSLSTAMAGFNPDRLFDLQFLMGIHAGVANYDGPKTFTWGAQAGLQGNFRLSDNLDIYVEPLAMANYVPARRSYKTWIPEGRLNLGLRYRLGGNAERGSLSDTPYGDVPSFVSLSVGPMAYAGTVSTTNLNIRPCFDVSLGRWLSMVSALRLTASNDFLRIGKNYTYLGAAHVDYLLNVTSLFERSAERDFHIIGALGVGLAYGENMRRPFAPVAYAGAQLRWNLPANIDIHAEPAIMVISQRALNADIRYGHSIMPSARLMVGASYRF